MPSGFNFAVYPEADWLGVALEWFMGNEHPLLETLPPEKFPAYRLNRMRQEWMVSDAFRGWFAVQHQGAMGTDRRTVDLMLFWGKVLHVTARCLPETSPAGLMNWTSEEWAWAIAQERSIWRELQPQDLLFNRNPREVMRWFQEGPFTRAGAIPQDSPDRLHVRRMAHGGVVRPSESGHVHRRPHGTDEPTLSCEGTARNLPHQTLHSWPLPESPSTYPPTKTKCPSP